MMTFNLLSIFNFIFVCLLLFALMAIEFPLGSLLFFFLEEEEDTVADAEVLLCDESPM